MKPVQFLSVFASITLLFAAGTAVHLSNTQKDAPSTDNFGFDLIARKNQLLNNKNTLKLNWLHTLNPLVKDVRGSLIWNTQKQLGVMELSGLPSLGKSQIYRLWIYDLEKSIDDPVLAASFRRLPQQTSKQLLGLVEPQTRVGKPYKFELQLEELNSRFSQPLLMAQQ